MLRMPIDGLNHQSMHHYKPTKTYHHHYYVFMIKSNRAIEKYTDILGPVKKKKGEKNISTVVSIKCILIYYL